MFSQGRDSAFSVGIGGANGGYAVESSLRRGPKRRELDAEARRDDLVQPHGPMEVLQLLLAEVAELDL